MKYTSYKGTQYEKKVIVPEHKIFSGSRYELADIFPNYGSYNGHKTAKNLANDLRAKGNKARIVAYSGFTAVYVR